MQQIISVKILHKCDGVVHTEKAPKQLPLMPLMPLVLVLCPILLQSCSSCFLFNLPTVHQSLGMTARRQPSHRFINTERNPQKT